MFLVPADICILIQLDFSMVEKRHALISIGLRSLGVLIVHRREIELDLMVCAW